MWSTLSSKTVLRKSTRRLNGLPEDYFTRLVSNNVIQKDRTAVKFKLRLRITIMCLVILLRPRFRLEPYINGSLPHVAISSSPRSRRRKSVSNWLRSKYPHVFQAKNISLEQPPTDGSLSHTNGSTISELPQYQEWLYCPDRMTV